MNCSNCHRAIPNDAILCPYCGYEQQVETLEVCSNCGRTIPDDAILCPYCGRRVKTQPPQPTESLSLTSPRFLQVQAILFFIWCIICTFCSLTSFFLGNRELLSSARSTRRTVIPTVEQQSSLSPTLMSTEAPPPTTTPGPLGESRNNPVPPGSLIEVDNMSIVIDDKTRPADTIIADGNSFNATPEPGNEYLMLSISATCNKDSDNDCSFYLSNFALVGSTGISREPKIMIAGVPNLLETMEFFGGAQLAGSVIFEVGQAETDLRLVYEPFFGNKIYMALPE